MKSRLCVLLFFLGGSFCANCQLQPLQQRKLDSLLAINNRYHQEDSLRVANLKAVFRYYANPIHDFAKFRLYADSAVAIASKLPSKTSLAMVYNRMGAAYHNIDRLQAITFYNKSIETARGAGAAALTPEAGSFLNLGALYMDLKDYPKSLEAHEQALELFARMGDIGDMSSCYMNMASIYANMGQKAKSMEYTRKALAIFEKNGSHRGVAIAYESLSEFYLTASDSELVADGVSPANRYREANTAIESELKAALQTDDPSVLSSVYRHQGQLYEMQGKNPDALKSYLKAVATNTDLAEQSYGDNLIYAGRFYTSKGGDFGKGISMMHAALANAERFSNTGTVEAALEALSEAYEKSRNYDSALYFYRRLILVRNQIFNQEKEQEVTRRQLKIDFDIKERDYRSAQQLSDARLKQQAQEILLRRQQLQLSDKEKSLQRLSFLQKQAELENQKKAQAALLTQQRLKADYDKKNMDNQISLQNVQLASNRRLSIFFALVAVIVIATAVLIYNSRKKTVQLNRVVSEQKRELEEMVSVKDKIFSVVSHDLRGPVNNMVAFSALLEQGDIQQDRLQLYMQQIRGTLDHTSTLMENLLNWAASQMKGFRPAIERVDVGPAVTHALKGVEQQMLQKNIVLKNEVPPHVHVRGDRNMIEVIVRNLINNAVKFSRPGGSLYLSAQVSNDKVILSIRDSGIGMEQVKVALINSGDSSAIESTAGTAKEKGTGLGLMLSKHFATLMGGNIQVDSEPGKGSCFSVLLPAA